jgi:hypothetical protein
MTQISENHARRETLLRGYLAVAAATLGFDLTDDKLIPALINMITSDLEQLVGQPFPAEAQALANDEPVEIPVLDLGAGQTIYFTFGGS